MAGKKIAKILISLIKIYQKVFSPDHSWRKIYYPFGFCKFYPSCSQYALESIAKKGVLAGLVKAVGRVFRCRPGQAGGYDPI